MAATDVTVLLTVFNETRYLPGALDGIIEQMDKLGASYTVVVANDGSTDWSQEFEKSLLSKKNVSLRNFYPNEGKGATLSRVFPTLESDYLVLIDADQEYHASDIPRILGPLMTDTADCVLGSRYGFGRPRPRQYLATYCVNRLINLWAFALSGKYFHDILCGLYGMRTKLVSDVCLNEKRFSYTGELFWALVYKNIRWKEAPVSYTFRTYEGGKKIKWWETFTLLKALWKYRYSRRDVRSG